MLHYKMNREQMFMLLAAFLLGYFFKHIAESVCGGSLVEGTGWKTTQNNCGPCDESKVGNCGVCMCGGKQENSCRWQKIDGVVGGYGNKCECD